MSIKKIDTRYGLKISTIEGCFATVHMALTGGIYPLGFIMLLGANEFHYGLLAAIPPLVNIIPVFTSVFLSRISSRKNVTAVTGIVSRFIWIIVPFIPCFFVKSTALMLFFVIYGISWASLAISGNVWTSWMSDLVPEKVRSTYFGRRNMYVTIVSFGITLAAGYFIANFQLDKNDPSHVIDISKGIGKFFMNIFPFTDEIMTQFGNSYKTLEFIGLSVLFIAGAAASLMSLFYILRQPEPAQQTFPSQEPFSWKEYRKDKNFNNLLLFIVLWGFLNGFAGPFWGAFQINNLSLTYKSIALMSLASQVARIIFIPIWGRLIQRYGNKPVMLFTVYFGVFHPLMYIVASPDFPLPIWWDYISSGIIWGGLELALFNMLLGVSPQRGKEVYYAIFSCFANVAAASSAMLAGSLASIIQSYNVQVAGMCYQQILFLWTSVARLAVLFWIMKLTDTGAKPITVMVNDISQQVVKGLMFIPRILTASEDDETK